MQSPNRTSERSPIRGARVASQEEWNTEAPLPASTHNQPQNVISDSYTISPEQNKPQHQARAHHRATSQEDWNTEAASPTSMTRIVHNQPQNATVDPYTTNHEQNQPQHQARTQPRATSEADWNNEAPIPTSMTKMTHIQPQNAMVDPYVVNPQQNQVQPQPQSQPQGQAPIVQITIHQGQPMYPVSNQMVNPHMVQPPQNVSHASQASPLLAPGLFPAILDNADTPDVTRKFNQPGQEGDDMEDGRPNAKRKTNMVVVKSKTGKCCCGIISFQRNTIANIYRIFIAIVTLPFAIIAFILRMISSLCKACFKCTKKVACKVKDDDVVLCCYMCSWSADKAAAVSTFFECDGKKVAKCCTTTSEFCDARCNLCTTACDACCASTGSGCGKCLEFFGNGTCSCLAFVQKGISACLQCGNTTCTSCAEGCGSVFVKCCGASTDFAGKCADSASHCYGVCMQCQCDCKICEVLLNCCTSCDKVDLSGCSSWLGECFSGSLVPFCQCLQGVLCNLVDVLAGILNVVKTIWDVIEGCMKICD